MNDLIYPADEFRGPQELAAAIAEARLKYMYKTHLALVVRPETAPDILSALVRVFGRADDIFLAVGATGEAKSLADLTGPEVQELGSFTPRAWGVRIESTGRKLDRDPPTRHGLHLVEVMDYYLDEVARHTTEKARGFMKAFPGLDMEIVCADFREVAHLQTELGRVKPRPAIAILVAGGLGAAAGLPPALAE